jgi:two-component system, LuxR family, sensor kinase FixL
MPTSNSLSSKDFEHLKSAIDEAAIVAITDRHGIITYANKKFLSISQYSEGELIGQNHRVINSGNHPKTFFVDMWLTISQGKVWEGEIRNRAKDGTFYWVNTTIVPFLTVDGQIERYVSVRYDITQRKNAEEKLVVYSDKLETSNRELQDFASVAAHDLQEPLRKIQSFADRLLKKEGDRLLPESRDYFDRIQKSAHRMQRLIDDLLTYSRVSNKTQPLSEVDLNQVMAHVVSDLEIRIENTKGIVQFGELHTVFADARQMHQLLLNLVNNALKFHRPATAPIIDVRTRLVARKNENYIEISVSDNGIGFDEKYLDRIFTIFQRLHGRDEYEGTGIGLAICRKIVERHSGIITAHSKLGEGSTFVISLPAKSTGPANEKSK